MQLYAHSHKDYFRARTCCFPGDHAQIVWKPVLYSAFSRVMVRESAKKARPVLYITNKVLIFCVYFFYLQCRFQFRLSSYKNFPSLLPFLLLLQLGKAGPVNNHRSTNLTYNHRTSCFLYLLNYII